MRKRTWIFYGVILILLVIASGRARLVSTAIAQSSAPAPEVSLPIFEKDMAWPKALPNNYYIGQVSGISVDLGNNIWISQRPQGEKNDNPVQDAKRITLYKDHPGVQAPSVIEFDNDGNYIQGWGGPDWVPQAAKGRKVPDDYRWFNDEHGILADQEGHIWVSGHTWAGDVAGPGPDLIDTHLLEFTHDGKFLMMIGHPHSWGGSNDKMNVGNTTTMALDTKANELYAADGEGNHRVIVFDAKKGTYKRHWGAYGGVPDDKLAEVAVDANGPASRQFGHRSVHCIVLAKDGLVYVCDRANWRIQVFHKDGTFVREAFVAKGTPGLGSIWSLVFSPDNKFLYVGDGTNMKIWFLRSDTLEVVGSYGDKNNPAMVVGAPHSMAVDSKGNIYIGGQNAAVNPARYLFKGYGSSASGR